MKQSCQCETSAEYLARVTGESVEKFEAEGIPVPDPDGLEWEEIDGE